LESKKERRSGHGYYVTGKMKEKGSVTNSEVFKTVRKGVLDGKK